VTEALLSAFGIVFLAELGDKSMLFSLTMAARYRWWIVFAAVSGASVLLMGLAVAVGGVAGELLPERLVAVMAAALFIGFGLWTLRPSSASDEDELVQERGQPQSIVRTVAFLGSVFFLAELGDKTQVAALSLAGLQGAAALPIWLGAAAGMIAVNGLAVLAGTRIVRLVPERTVRIASGVLFIAFGVAALVLALR
jgi:putative Ca2+/H+ antiporter (TMEM165/GDT1 family)